jgi:hypothetical protein
MITKICPGDLYVYLDNDGYEYPTLSTHTMSEGKNFRVLSTKSGWTFHIMNKANPIPGEYCEACISDLNSQGKRYILLSGHSEGFNWNKVIYYRVVTPVQGEAKKMAPKVGYTTTVELVVDHIDEDGCLTVIHSDGLTTYMNSKRAAKFEWKAPPPVLEVGKKAKNRSSGEVVTISAIGTIKVLAIDSDGCELSWCKFNMIPLGDDEQ